MATQDNVAVKDSATSTNCDVDGIDIPSTGSNPASGHSIRQAVTIGDGGGTLQYAGVTAGGALSVADPSTGTTETTTLLTSAQTFNGTAHDTTLTGQAGVEVSSIVSGGQAGTLKIQQSDDNSNWFTIAQLAVTGSTVNHITAFISMRYWRAVYINGITGQSGTFALISTASESDIPLTVQTATYSGAVVPATILEPLTSGAGSQGAASLQASQPKDLNRNPIWIGTGGLTGVAAETLITCSITKGLVAQSNANTYTVSAGKVFRVQAITASLSEGATTTEGFIRVRIGGATTGTVVAQFGFPYGSTAATVPGAIQNLPIPDGMEFASGTVLSFCQLAGSTAQKVDVQMIGYEYTPI